MPTVIYLHPHFTIEGGAGRYVLETATRLALRGYRVKVLSVRAAPQIVGDAKKSVDFIDLGGPISSKLGFWLRFPFTFLKILKIVDQNPGALIFAQVFPANWWGFLVKKLRPARKMVWMCQEPSAFIHSQRWIEALSPGLMKTLAVHLNPLLKSLDLYLAKSVDLVFANSNFSKSSIHEVYKYPDELVAVTYLGADHATFQPGSSSREANVITIGRLTKFKNVDLIIRAIKKLHVDGLSGVSLTIVGKGEAEAELVQLVRELDLQRAVHFSGAVSTPELIRLIQQAQVFVLASVGEPFGLVAVEAMACGTPAIVAANGGPSETVVHNVSGILLETMDADSIFFALKTVFTNPALFQKLSDNALQRSQLYDWDKTVEMSAFYWRELLPNPYISGDPLGGLEIASKINPAHLRAKSTRAEQAERRPRRSNGEGGPD